MQQKRLLTIAAYAKLRGLNRSTVSRQVRDGKIPITNGKVDPVAADQARERNLDQSKCDDAVRRKEEAREPAARRGDISGGSSPSRVLQAPPQELPAHTAVLGALRRISSDVETLNFARMARGFGASPIVAFCVAMWHSSAAVDAAMPEVTIEELSVGFTSPSEDEWREVLGEDFDFGTADSLYDKLTLVSTGPAIRPEAPGEKEGPVRVENLGEQNEETK